MKRSNKSNLLPLISSALLALIYTFPFLMKLHHWGVRDWDLFLAVLGAPLETISHYGQFPFWNPWMGGGNILFHHPEVGIVTPFFLLHWFFGILVGLKLQVLVCYFLGFYGTQKLAQRLGMSSLAALLAAVAYFGSVHFALHFAEGHIPFTHFCFLPWLIYFLQYEVNRVKSLLWASLVLALMILGNGAAIPLLYTLTFTGLLALLLTVEKKSARALIDFISACLGGILLSAIKFVPMVIYLARNRWEGAPDESIPFSALGTIFFSWDQSHYANNFSEQLWGWHEYGAYLSPLLIILAMVAVIKRFGKTRIYLFLALFFLLLGMGNFSALSPWALLSKLPGFSSARCTGRSFHLVILSVSLLGGFGFDYLRQFWQKENKVKGYALWAGLVIIVFSNIGLAWPIMSSGFTVEGKEVVRNTVFKQVINRQAKAFENLLTNQGALISPWLSAYHPSRALVDELNVVHADYIVSGQAEVEQRIYTPNQINYVVRSEVGGQIVIGMGFDEGWEIENGPSLERYNNLISWHYNRSRTEYKLTYTPPGFWLGLMISLLSFVAFVLLYRKSTSS